MFVHGLRMRICVLTLGAHAQRQVPNSFHQRRMRTINLVVTIMLRIVVHFNDHHVVLWCRDNQ